MSIRKCFPFLQPIAARKYSSYKLLSSICLVFLYFFHQCWCFASTSYNCVIENTNSFTTHKRLREGKEMKWSQQKNTSKHNYFIGKINANHAQEGKKERKKKKKRFQNRSINKSFQFLITKSKQCLQLNCFLN